MSESRTSLRLIRTPRFGAYIVGNFASNIGNWFQNVAAGIVVFELTGSNTLVGTVSVLQFLATLVLSPYSGALADSFNRRKLLILAQCISATGAVGLAIWVGLEGVEGLPGVWPVLAATGVIGLGYAVGISAMNALIPALVEPAELEDAIALNSSSFTLARAIGPALAGLVVAAAGAGWAFGINALTFLPLIIVLMLIRPREIQRDIDRDRSVRAGFAYVRERTSMLWIVLATLTVGWAGDPVNTLAPAYADMFGRDETFVGLQVAAFGAGAALMSMFVGVLRRRLDLEATTRTGMVILALGLLGFAIAFHEAIVLLSLFVAGVGFLLGVTTTNSNLQHRLHEDMRGRVMALWSMAFLGSRPIAGLIDGGVADLVSPRVGVLTAIVPLFLGWWAIGKVRPEAKVSAD
ncbi:MAG TPA: MFS transporter [Acidimicrobiia bacterium]|nr:MFS transporter [Acidimicrobiia bacterium]